MFEAAKNIFTGMAIPRCKICGGKLEKRFAGGWECTICEAITMEPDWEPVPVIDMNIIT